MTIPIDPPPSYNTQIPVGSTTIAEAQKLFQNNFERLFEAFNTDHVSLIDPTNPGNHSVIRLVELPKSESTLPSEIAIYSKKVEGQTDQLFMRQQGNGTEFQLTEFQIYTIQPNDNQKAYFSLLPGGIIVYFGRVVGFAQKEVNIDINPPASNILGVNLAGITTVSQQPNVSLVGNSQTKISVVKLKSIDPIPDQFYLFFGNL